MELNSSTGSFDKMFYIVIVTIIRIDLLFLSLASNAKPLFFWKQRLLKKLRQVTIPALLNLMST